MKESWHSPIELKLNVFSKPRTVMIPKCRCIAWRKWRVACENYGECTTFSATEFQVVSQDKYIQAIKNVTECFQNGIWIQYLLLYPSPYFTTTKGKNIKSTANKCNKIKQLIMNYFLKVNVILPYVRETYTLFYYPA